MSICTDYSIAVKCLTIEFYLRRISCTNPPPPSFSLSLSYRPIHTENLHSTFFDGYIWIIENVTDIMGGARFYCLCCNIVYRLVQVHGVQHVRTHGIYIIVLFIPRFKNFRISFMKFATTRMPIFNSFFCLFTTHEHVMFEEIFLKMWKAYVRSKTFTFGFPLCSST